MHPQRRLLGEILTHSVDLSRFSAGLERRAVRRLLAAAQEIVGMLAAPGPLTEFRRGRMHALAVQIADTLATAADAALVDVVRELRQLAKVEASAAAGELNHALAVPVATVGISASQLEALADPDVLQLDLGRRMPLRQWWEAMAGQATEAARQSITTGMLLGEGIDGLARRLLGEHGKAVGVLAHHPRQHVMTLVRTSVMQVSNQSRMLVYDQNADLIDGYEHHSSIDQRTSLPCQVRNSKRWTSGPAADRRPRRAVSGAADPPPLPQRAAADLARLVGAGRPRCRALARQARPDGGRAPAPTAAGEGLEVRQDRPGHGQRPRLHGWAGTRHPVR